jgi:hypothetical protein
MAKRESTIGISKKNHGNAVLKIRERRIRK